MRILKSNIIGNLRDCVIRVRQLSHCAVHFGFQDELLQCHPGALVEEGGEVFVVVAEITGEFGDFEGLAAVVLDVADDVLQDLCPLRFGSVGAVEGALAVDFAEKTAAVRLLLRNVLWKRREVSWSCFMRMMTRFGDESVPWRGMHNVSG